MSIIDFLMFDVVCFDFINMFLVEMGVMYVWGECIVVCLIFIFF